MGLISLESPDLIGEKNQKPNESVQQVQEGNKLNVKVERDQKNLMKRDDSEVENDRIRNSEKRVVENILLQTNIKLSQSYLLQ